MAVNYAASKATLAAYRATVPKWKLAMSKWAYNISYFNQLGLLQNDTLKETPEVKEAIRRLPAHIQDERQFRITRALYLSMRKEILPKEEWSKWEDDVKYLQPYLDEVTKEFREQEEWNKKWWRHAELFVATELCHVSLRHRESVSLSCVRENDKCVIVMRVGRQ